MACSIRLPITRTDWSAFDSQKKRQQQTDSVFSSSFVLYKTLEDPLSLLQPLMSG
jgi:hypothetical protein